MVISKLSAWMLKSSGTSGYEKVHRKTKPANKAVPHMYFQVQRVPSTRPAAPVSGGHWGPMQGNLLAANHAAEGFVWHLLASYAKVSCPVPRCVLTRASKW